MVSVSIRLSFSFLARVPVLLKSELSIKLYMLLLTVPGPVGSLSFDNILDTSLQVIWTPPTDLNGVLVGVYGCMCPLSASKTKYRH